MRYYYVQGNTDTWNGREVPILFKGQANTKLQLIFGMPDVLIFSRKILFSEIFEFIILTTE